MLRINKTIIFFCWSSFFWGDVCAMEMKYEEPFDHRKGAADLYVELVEQMQKKVSDIISFINEGSVIESIDVVSDDGASQRLFEEELASKLKLLATFFSGQLLDSWHALSETEKYQRNVYNAADTLSQTWLDFLCELPSGEDQRRFERLGAAFVLPEVVDVLACGAELFNGRRYSDYIRALRLLQDKLEEQRLTAADRIIAVNVIKDYLRWARSKKKQLYQQRQLVSKKGKRFQRYKAEPSQ